MGTLRRIAIAGALGGVTLASSCAKRDAEPGPEAGTTVTLDGGGPSAGVLTIEHQYDLPSTCQEITLEARHDAARRPYVYAAALAGGLRIYDVSGAFATAPKLVATLPTSQLGSLSVMNLSQNGELLFLALGNTFGTAVQTAGMAIVDVREPASPRLAALWQDASLRGGTGIAVSDGSYAYLGAMGNGLIIFDTTDPTKPREVSRFVPPLDFPDAQPDAKKINARGMEIVGATVYLAYDAGGMRIIDVADRTNPKEVGRYSNPALNGKPRAYNSVVLDGTIAYVGFDYCGVEVLDVGNPSAVKSVSWWNPWRCEESPLNWFSSGGHANELALDRVNRLLFVSSGKSDLEVLDVTNPAAVARVGGYGGGDNGIGTWGVSIYDDEILLTYTCAIVPFVSNWTGVKGLSYRR